MKSINRRQSGNAAKFAAAPITVIDMPESPQRWVAGADAIEGVPAGNKGYWQYTFR
jgi:hypothetical protein